ncbi:recombinase family protein [Salmonella enterica subsp. enterica serovar Infantis]
MATIGYIRVSTIDQNIDLQRNALTWCNIVTGSVLSDAVSVARLQHRPGRETGVTLCM